MPRKERRKRAKKTLHDAADALDDICFDLEEIFNCGDIVPEHDVEYTVMEMSAKDHIRLFESMQKYIEKMRKEVEFILQNI